VHGKLGKTGWSRERDTKNASAEDSVHTNYNDMRFTATEAEHKRSQEIGVVGVCEIAVEVVAATSDIAETPVEATSGSLRGLGLDPLRILGDGLPARKQISRTRNSSICHTTIFWITHLS